MAIARASYRAFLGILVLSAYTACAPSTSNESQIEEDASCQRNAFLLPFSFDSFISGNPGSSQPQLAVALPISTLPVGKMHELRLQIGGNPQSTQVRFWRGAPNLFPQSGIVFVSGVDGGFVEPVDGIYTRLAEKLASRGVSSIFVQYREPGELETSIKDAMAGASFLKTLGASRLAVSGWSFGGAVILNTAVRVPEVSTLIAFASQAKDTEAAAQLRSQSLLLIHSDSDENVPYEASQEILAEVPPQVRARLHPIEGADHLLTGTADQIDPLVTGWLEQKLELGRVRPSRCGTPSS